MGICVSKSNRKITLLMVGLDNAGKTSTAKGIVGQLSSFVVPTLGFASFKTKQKHFDVTIYDVGGGENIRGIWKYYIAESFGFIYVVDASDSTRFQECREVLHTLLKNPAVSGKPLLILANKQDADGARDEHEIEQILDVEMIVNEVKCPTRVETCSANKGKGEILDRGVASGFRWLLTIIKQDYVRLQEKVTKDQSVQRELEDQERIQREERIRKLREERAKTQNENDIKEVPVIKEDPFKPLTVVVKEIDAKESKHKEEVDINMSTLKELSTIDDNTNSDDTKSTQSPQMKNVSDIISDSPFGKEAEVTLTDSTEVFELVGPPGSIGDENRTQIEVISRQSTIDENDSEVLISPNHIASSDQNGPKKKRLFRRKNKTAPLPPVQNHSMLRDLPPLNPIVTKNPEFDNNEVLSRELVEKLDMSNLPQR